MQEFIATLTGEQKDSILVELLSNGSGSIDYAKKLLDFGGTVPELPPLKPSWCVCVAFVDPCQLKRKTNVVGRLHVSHPLSHLGMCVLIERYLLWLSGPGVT